MFLLGTPLIALIGIPWHIMHYGISWVGMTLFFSLWYVIGISITAGYHRLFSHRSYLASAPVRLFFLMFGAAAIQTSVLQWSYKHRIHHAHVDQDIDPYNIRRGFWWAHIGWVMFSDRRKIDPAKVVDLLRDPLVVWQNKYYHLIVVLVALGIPVVVGLLTGDLLGCLLYGVVLRIVMTHHVTFFINSLCHMVGRQPYSLRHSARDSAIMALLAFGEGYHNYHHTFPFDYRNGIRSWHIDPAKWLIASLHRLRLAGKLQRAPSLAILKARFRVEFEKSLGRLERLSGETRAAYAQQVHDAYDALQKSMRQYFEYFHTNRATLARPQQGSDTAGFVRSAFESAQRAWHDIVTRVHSMPAEGPSPRAV